jgi:hypothetical protein
VIDMPLLEYVFEEAICRYIEKNRNFLKLRVSLLTSNISRKDLKEKRMT